jgi:hypothetical protein
VEQETGGTDWVAWHAEYDDPSSRLSRRLVEVQRQLRAALDRAPAGPLRLVSACAGQGRDVIPVLSSHPRGADVTARLVEYDRDLSHDARNNALIAGLENVDVITGDAGDTYVYADAVPAHIAVFCGVFGNVTDDDIAHTVRTLPTLLAPGGEVLWTRHAYAPDLTPSIRRWFADAGFEEMAWTCDADSRFGVGTQRLAATTTPAPFEAGVTLFRFNR